MYGIYLYTLFMVLTQPLVSMHRTSQEFRTDKENYIAQQYEEDKKTLSHLYVHYEYNGCDKKELPQKIAAGNAAFQRVCSIHRDEAVQKIKQVLDTASLRHNGVNRNFLQLLLYMPKIERDAFVAESVEKSDVFLKNIVEAYYENCTSFDPLQEVPVDIDGLAQTLFSNDMTQSSMRHAAVNFLRNAPESFFLTHHNNIITAAPSLIEHAVCGSEALLKVATTYRTIPGFSRAILQALVQYTSRKDRSFRYDYIMKHLLKNEAYQEDEQAFVYGLMNRTYQKNKDAQSLQLLWLHLYDRSENRALLQSSCAEFFRVSGVAPSQNTYAYMQEILQQATISDDVMLETIEIATETGFAKYMDKDFLLETIDAYILNDTMPIAQRCRYVDLRFLHTHSHDEVNDFLQKLTTAEDIDFIDYCKSYFMASIKDCHAYQRYEAKKRLRFLCEKYGIRNDNEYLPKGILYTFGGIVNKSYALPTASQSDNQVIVDGGWCCEKSYFDPQGLLYIVENGQSRDESNFLYALDPQSLEPVWDRFIKDIDQVKYHVADDYIYLVEDNQVAVLDKDNGVELACYDLPYVEKAEQYYPLSFVKTDRDCTLYVVQYHAQVAIINSSTDNVSVISFTPEEQASHGAYYIAGNTFCMYNGNHGNKQLTFYKDNQVSHTIDCNRVSGKGLFDHPIVIAEKYNPHLIYTDMQTGNQELVAFHTDIQQEAWRIFLDNHIQKGIRPLLTAHNILFFVDTQNYLKAFDISKATPELLWQTKVEKKSYFSSGNGVLQLNHEADALHLLLDSEILYRFDLQSGEICSQETSKVSIKKLLGVTNGTSFIHFS